MTREGDVPQLHEVREQLDRILASETFAKKLTLRPLLERLVKDTIAGKVGGEGYETLLAKELWKEKDWSPTLSGKVRQNLGNLREALTTYYSAEGVQEPIEIDFRQGYSAEYCYRHVDDVAASVEWLADSFGNAFPERWPSENIVSELEACVREHPSYAPGFAFLAEAILTCSMCDDTHPSGMAEAIVRAEEFVKTGMALHRGLWRMHVVAGAVHCCRFAWRDAETSFGTALRLAPDDTRGHFWYAAFLLSVGRREEAKQVINARRERPRTLLRPYIVPLFRYLLRQFQHAHRELAVKPPFLHRAADRTVYCVNADIEIRDERAAKALTSCLVTALTSELGRLEEKGRCESPLPSSDEATAELKRAGDSAHPLILWLHLWPLFDALGEPPQSDYYRIRDSTFQVMLKAITEKR